MTVAAVRRAIQSYLAGSPVLDSARTFPLPALYNGIASETRIA